MNKTEIEKVHTDLLTAWNNRDSQRMASLFCENGNVIGFDGSQMNGQVQIKSELEKVFADHETAAYVWTVEEVRFLSTKVALLRAIVGMIPPGKKEINPPTNAIQSLVAILENNSWKITLFQNTPAQFHGRPELVQSMTMELNKLIEP